MAEEQPIGSSGKEEGERGAESPVILPIRWTEPGAAVYADEVILITTEHALHLIFYQVVPPVSPVGTDPNSPAGTHEERLKALRSLRSVDARPMAHLVLPAKKITAILRALEKHAGRAEKASLLPQEPVDGVSAVAENKP